MHELREHQRKTIDAVLAAHAHGYRSVLVEAATGSGKSRSAAECALHAVRAGLRVLVIAHRIELITQMAAELRSLGLSAGIERGASYAKNEQVVVASVQTLRASRLVAFPVDEFGLIIVDECHHAPAQGYRDILAHFACARVLGVTATADRMDGASLGNVFDVCAFRYGIAEAVRDGVLVPARGIQITVEGMDLSKVRQRIAVDVDASNVPGAERHVKDLHPKDLGRAAIAPEAVEGVVGPLLELAGERRTIVFAVDKKHARAIAKSICARHPGAARSVDSSMRSKDRAETIAAHARGEYQFLVNCMLLTEGYNDPAIECVAIARPTQSRVFYAQAVGRALRLFAGKTEGLLLDFVGVSCAFKLVGPEDVLAGALVAPVVRLSARRAGKPSPDGEYQVVLRKMGFAYRVVQLVGAAGKRVKRSWFGKFVSNLVG